MKKPPFYLQILHDETTPVGSLGRGTHYSVYRGVVFHDSNGNLLPKAQHFDFAVIWDEDHNTEIFEVIDDLYRSGELCAFTIFGERKGRLTAIRSADPVSEARTSALTAKLQSLCNDLVDSWSSCVVSADDANNEIIDDTDRKVQLYMANIQMLWSLGLKKTEPY